MVIVMRGDVVQAIGRAWEESLLLRLAVNAEEVVERKEPKVHYQILVVHKGVVDLSYPTIYDGCSVVIVSATNR